MRTIISPGIDPLLYVILAAAAAYGIYLLIKKVPSLEFIETPRIKNEMRDILKKEPEVKTSQEKDTVLDPMFEAIMPEMSSYLSVKTRVVGRKGKHILAAIRFSRGGGRYYAFIAAKQKKCDFPEKLHNSDLLVGEEVRTAHFKYKSWAGAIRFVPGKLSIPLRELEKEV
ncbi:MAG: hypothetical protein R6V53_06040 [Candidatus Woesearchaeota archaeon]